MEWIKFLLLSQRAFFQQKQFSILRNLPWTWVPMFWELCRFWSSIHHLLHKSYTLEWRWWLLISGGSSHQAPKKKNNLHKIQDHVSTVTDANLPSLFHHSLQPRFSQIFPWKHPFCLLFSYSNLKGNQIMTNSRVMCKTLSQLKLYVNCKICLEAKFVHIDCKAFEKYGR